MFLVSLPLNLLGSIAAVLIALQEFCLSARKKWKIVESELVIQFHVLLDWLLKSSECVFF